MRTCGVDQANPAMHSDEMYEAFPSCGKMIGRIATVIFAGGLLIPQVLASEAVKHALGEIRVKGHVSVNGMPGIGGGSIFSGDRIYTQTRSVAAISLTSGGEVIQAGPGTLIVRDGGSKIMTIAVEAGKAAVLSRGAVPVEVQAEGVRIVPRREGAVYIIEISGQKLSVTALKGNAEIKASNKTVEVREGMVCEADLDTSTAGASGRSSALSMSITKFSVVSAAVVSAAAISVILAEPSTGCPVSASSIGSCQAVR